jgi:hypothetical protein
VFKVTEKNKPGDPKALEDVKDVDRRAHDEERRFATGIPTSSICDGISIAPASCAGRKPWILSRGLTARAGYQRAIGKLANNENRAFSAFLRAC